MSQPSHAEVVDVVCLADLIQWICSWPNKKAVSWWLELCVTNSLVSKPEGVSPQNSTQDTMQINILEDTSRQVNDSGPENSMIELFSVSRVRLMHDRCPKQSTNGQNTYWLHHQGWLLHCLMPHTFHTERSGSFDSGSPFFIFKVNREVAHKRTDSLRCKV